MKVRVQTLNRIETLVFVSVLLSTAAAGAAEPPVFKEFARQAGLDFSHFNGMSGEFYFPEMTGQGGGFLDYDNDGDLDVYLVQGAMLGAGKTLDDALFPPEDPAPKDRLFRNDLELLADGTRVLTFADVTEQSGLRGFDYGMGVAVGDFDNDGFVDLYVTNYGPNRLWRNRGDGTFGEVTHAAGAADERWSIGASFLDYDRDGWLDLYVVNYVEFSLEKNPRCFARDSRRDYCGPAAFEPQADRLLHNRGGVFEEVTTEALLDYRARPGLGVLGADVNGDGWPDLYVANDGTPNQLWLNLQDGTFRDEGLFSGTAVNRAGRAEASMGVVAADIDNDGDEDLFMTHLMSETNTLYINDGSGLFDDQTSRFQLAVPSIPYTAFGVGALDYDNDGWLDLLVANGAVAGIEEQVRAGERFPLRQSNQLFRNLDGRGFADVTAAAGPAFALPEVSRGAAFGDVDNDGDTDVLITNNNGPVRLLLNQVGSRKPWLGLRLLDEGAKRDMLGAWVGVERTELPSLWRRAHSDGSYASANDPRVLIGLGGDAPVTALRIVWPDGTEQRRKPPPLRRYTTVHKGEADR